LIPSRLYFLYTFTPSRSTLIIDGERSWTLRATPNKEGITSNRETVQREVLLVLTMIGKHKILSL